MNNGELRLEKSPWYDLMLLLTLVLVCSIVVQFVVLMGSYFFGEAHNMPQVNDAALSFYLLLASSSISTFLLPSIFLNLCTQRAYVVPSAVEGVKLLPMVFLIGFFYNSMPLMSLLGEWNQQLSLPDAFSTIEQWMRQQEDTMAALTASLVMNDQIPMLMLNILVMAVLPAICEEYFFRGSLTQIFQRVFRHHHLTIWVVATIFSAIHFQFFGFFPRLILGAIFGYLMHYSQNILYPIAAHFLNNVTVTIAAFYFARQGKTYNDFMEHDTLSIFTYLGCLFLALYFAWLFFQYSKKSPLWKKNG